MNSIMGLTQYVFELSNIIGTEMNNVNEFGTIPISFSFKFYEAPFMQLESMKTTIPT